MGRSERRPAQVYGTLVRSASLPYKLVYTTSDDAATQGICAPRGHRCFSWRSRLGQGAAGDNLIIDIHRDEVEANEDWDDGSGWLAALAPLRADVLSGDFR